uniref:Uncharacterized protein n=1 Tax=Anopheles darlingi TaxID=43151 RepID=A0A2M4D0G4_ANODA
MVSITLPKCILPCLPFTLFFFFCFCISTTSMCRSILVDLILIYCFPPCFPANMCFFFYFVNLKTHHNRNRCA